MVARKIIKIASDYERICERILRAIACNELLFNGFTLANILRLGKKMCITCGLVRKKLPVCKKKPDW